MRRVRLPRGLVAAWPALALMFLLCAVRIVDPPVLGEIRNLGFDVYQRSDPRPPSDSPVLVVDIDDRSLAAHGQWPWPRTDIARMLDRLRQLGAAAIGFDILFAEPDRLGSAGDATLAVAMRAVPTALGFARSPDAAALSNPPKAGVAISGSDPRPWLPVSTRAVTPLPVLLDAAAGLGSLSLGDGQAGATVREVPLLWRSGDDFQPALSIETLRLAVGASTFVALSDPQGQTGLEGLRIGPFTARTDPAGGFLLYDQAASSTPSISAQQLFEAADPSLERKVTGRIVLVGTSASGLLDLHSTPLGHQVPGVMIHAEVIDQIVSGVFLSRAEWLQAAEIMAFAAAALLLSFVVLRIGPRAGLTVTICLLVAFGSVAYAAFVYRGWLVDASFPLAGLLVVYGGVLYLRFASTDRDRRALRRAFSHYVAPELLTRIEAQVGELHLGGEVRELTVMFTDMRGFTAYTEAHRPDETLRLLNTMFTSLGAEVVNRSGTIDKFIGDSIMAFWNAPLAVADHARQGSEAALAMRRRLDELSRRELTPISVGIGLATGEALVGNMGLESRFDYSAIGDAVNVASRAEGESKRLAYDIVGSEATRAASPDLAWLYAGTVTLKGKRERTPLHILVGDAEMAASTVFQRLVEAHSVVVGTLAQGNDADFTDLIEMAREIEPRLEAFYLAMALRSEDFRSPP